MIEKIVFGFLFSGALGSAALADIRKHEIPDPIHICIVLLGFIKLLIPGLSLIGLADAVAGALIAGIPLLIVAVKSNGLGGGDVKLASGCGFFLGLGSSCSALVFSLLLFLLFSVLYIRTKKLDWKTPLPFAPFYMIAGVTVYFVTLI